jgi:hypothetical protein
VPSRLHSTKITSLAGCSKLAPVLVPRPLCAPGFPFKWRGKREPTSGLEPLTYPHYEPALIRLWVFLTVPKTAYLSHVLLANVADCSPLFA